MTPTLLWVVAVGLMLVGFAGIVLPALPGVPLMFAGMWLAAWIDGYERIGATALVILGVLTVATLIVDFVSGSLGARRAGASRQAVIGAAIGTVFGLFLGLFGLLLGPLVGAFVGELMASGGPQRALRVGVASWLGFVAGTVLKVAIAFTMAGVFIAAWLIP